MRTALGCLPCFVRQADEAARLCGAEPTAQEDLLRRTLRYLAEADLHQAPPAIVREIQRLLRRATGSSDPYAEQKARFDTLARGLLPRFRQRVTSSADPLLAAARLSIAGNVIDLGAKSGLTEGEAHRALEAAFETPLTGDADLFRHDVEMARHVLFLADNAGEIILDRILIEQLLPRRVTVVVRGAPVINDATLVDAHAAGLDEIAEVVENGSDAPGTLLEECTPYVRRWFRDADLVIAKGQGNYETLSHEKGRIQFLLRVKCRFVADLVGAPIGAHVLRAAPRARAAEVGR